MRLQDKSAVVTAAGAGIGLATATAFIAEGAQVTAIDIDANALRELADLGCRTEILDVTDTAAVLQFAAKTEVPDILFNCAGYVHHGTILDCDEEAFNFSFKLNVQSMYQVTRAFLPAMINAGGGNIINMASVASSIIAAPNRFVYGATKAAVIGMTKSIAADFISQGIRCNAICPGTVDSPSLQARIRAQGNFEKAHSAFVARQPMGRIARAEEIGSLATYLASDESAFITGQAMTIDGGWSNV
ncbi:SDR family oxidoreductase [Pseudopelagicola sp. nBUS_19]|uniref:SDR family oxidoreductase n=1 Tax=unclassified Pseudopelagicola TaxID=2649563 RepID=UPI003EBB4883